MINWGTVKEIELELEGDKEISGRDTNLCGVSITFKCKYGLVNMFFEIPQSKYDDTDNDNREELINLLLDLKYITPKEATEIKDHISVNNL